MSIEITPGISVKALDKNEVRLPQKDYGNSLPYEAAMKIATRELAILFKRYHLDKYAMLRPVIAGGRIEAEIMHALFSNKYTIGYPDEYPSWWVGFPGMFNRKNLLLPNNEIITLNKIHTAHIVRRAVRDVDVFVSPTDPVALRSLLMELFEISEIAWKGPSAYSFIIGESRIPVQIIITNQLDILEQFDLDCCAALFDGKEIIPQPRAITAWRTFSNIWRPEKMTEAFEYRTRKYMNLGYDLILPLEYEKDRTRWNLKSATGILALFEKSMLKQEFSVAYTGITCPAARHWNKKHVLEFWNAPARRNIYPVQGCVQTEHAIYDEVAARKVFGLLLDGLYSSIPYKFVIVQGKGYNTTKMSDLIRELEVKIRDIILESKDDPASVKIESLDETIAKADKIWNMRIIITEEWYCYTGTHLEPGSDHEESSSDEESSGGEGF